MQIDKKKKKLNSVKSQIHVHLYNYHCDVPLNQEYHSDYNGFLTITLFQITSLE